MQYQAYLVRLWRDATTERWLALAQHVSSGEQQVFSDIEALFDFLRSEASDS